MGLDELPLELRAFVSLVAIIVTLSYFGFLEQLAKGVAVMQAKKEFLASVSIEDLQLSLTSVVMRGIVVRNRKGFNFTRPHAAEIDHVHVRFDPLSMLTRFREILSVEVSGVRVFIEQVDGVLNLSTFSKTADTEIAEMRRTAVTLPTSAEIFHAAEDAATSLSNAVQRRTVGASAAPQDHAAAIDAPPDARAVRPARPAAQPAAAASRWAPTDGRSVATLLQQSATKALAKISEAADAVKAGDVDGAVSNFTEMAQKALASAAKGSAAVLSAAGANGDKISKDLAHVATFVDQKMTSVTDSVARLKLMLLDDPDEIDRVAAAEDLKRQAEAEAARKRKLRELLRYRHGESPPLAPPAAAGGEGEGEDGGSEAEREAEGEAEGEGEDGGSQGDASPAADGSDPAGRARVPRPKEGESIKWYALQHVVIRDVEVNLVSLYRTSERQSATSEGEEHSEVLAFKEMEYFEADLMPRWALHEDDWDAQAGVMPMTLTENLRGVQESIRKTLGGSLEKGPPEGWVMGSTTEALKTRVLRPFVKEVVASQQGTVLKSLVGDLTTEFT